MLYLLALSYTVTAVCMRDLTAKVRVAVDVMSVLLHTANGILAFALAVNVSHLFTRIASACVIVLGYRTRTGAVTVSVQL